MAGIDAKMVIIEAFFMIPAYQMRLANAMPTLNVTAYT